MFEYRALVDKVHDGDTFHAKIDLGFDTWLSSWVRLDGIDTPELTFRVDGKVHLDPAGEEATQFLLSTLGVAPAGPRTRSYFGVPGDYLIAPGQEPLIELRTKLGQEHEKYGRVLAVARFPMSATTINNIMGVYRK